MIACILILPHWGLTSVTNWTGISQLWLMYCLPDSDQPEGPTSTFLPWEKAGQTQRQQQNRASDLPPSFSVVLLSWPLLHVPSAVWGTSEDHGGIVGQFSECFPRKMGRKLGKLYSPPSFRWLRLTRSPWVVYLFSPTSFLSHPDPTLRVTREDVKREVITFFFILDFQTCLSF